MDMYQRNKKSVLKAFRTLFLELIYKIALEYIKIENLRAKYLFNLV